MRILQRQRMIQIPLKPHCKKALTISQNIRNRHWIRS